MPLGYTPNSTWEAPVITGGTPVTPERMQVIEDGVAAVSDAHDELVAGDTTIGAATPTDGDVLTYDTVTGWGAAAPTGGGGGGAADLDDLTDVDVTTVAPTDGQALVFDTADSLWKPATVSGGSGATDLEGLSDVDLTTPADRDVLRYESSSSQWKNEPLAVDVSELDTTGTPDGTKFLRDDGAWATPAGGGGGSAAGAMVYLNAATLTAAAGARTVLLDTVEHADTGFSYNTSTGEMTLTNAGWYSVYGHVRFSTNATGASFASITVSGSPVILGANLTNTTTEVVAVGVDYFAAGTVLKLEVTSGSSVSVQGSNRFRTTLRIVRFA